jgi:hypothetical protein
MLMSYPSHPVLAFTRADARRARPSRGPARATSIRFFRADCGPLDRLPARSPSGRYLYLLPRPLPVPPWPDAADQSARGPEVG